MSTLRDLKTFEILYKKHFVFLSLAAYQITKDMDASKDIVQDFFISLWNSDKTLDLETEFKPYCYKAVKNLSLKYIEKNKTKISEKDSLILKTEEQPPIEEDNIKAGKIVQLLDKIPAARKHIFISHIVNGLSYSEIAESQNISINTVKTQMKRVYAFIREELNNDAILIFLFITLKSIFQ